MSSREPLWFCHECHAEMRPLMAPDPICASCRGSFVEKLENPADDPREFQNRAPDMFNMPSNIPGAFEGFLRAGLVSPSNDAHPSSSTFLASWPAAEGTPTNSSTHRPRSPPAQRTQDHSPATTGLRFEFHSGPGGGGTRTFVFDGNNPLGPSSPSAEHPVPTMFEFLRREAGNANNRAHGDITGPLMAQYLLALFGREPHGQGDPFADMFGMPPSARWGDYVFNQEALDHILTQLAENSTAGRPVPATEEIISDLPREVLTQGSPLLERDCAVCKESFKLDPEDPDELIVVTLPCKHPFHEGCILPWLNSSGTCPVCRYALITQPQHSPGRPPGGNSNSSPPNPSSGSRQHSSGNSDRGGAGNIFHAIFGGGAGASSGNNDTHSRRSRRNLGRNNTNTPPEAPFHSTPPLPGRWIEDID